MANSRKIAFRAWDKEKKRMSTEEWWTIHNGGVWYVSDELDGSNGILMQFTGKKDKNGVEIYEGDIVRDKGRLDVNNKTYFSLYTIEFGPCGVSSYEGSWDSIGWFANCFAISRDGLLEPYNKTICGLNEVDDMEIIGDIYQNPELLNK